MTVTEKTPIGLRNLTTVPASVWMLVTVETTVNQPSEVGPPEDEEAGSIQWAESEVVVGTVC